MFVGVVGEVGVLVVGFFMVEYGYHCKPTPKTHAINKIKIENNTNAQQSPYKYRRRYVKQPNKNPKLETLIERNSYPRAQG